MLRAMLVAVCGITLTMSADLAAQQNVRLNLQGLNGKVSVNPNAKLEQTTIAFTSSVPLNSTSNQIVFVVQMSGNSAFPKAWSGQARVLSGDGVLVISPVAENGTSSNSGMVFRFAGTPIPPSVKDWPLASFAAYGIARYGETTPLSDAQVDSLATTGKYASEKQPSNFALSSRSFLPDETNPNPPVCSAGGPGATACGAGSGGCTVSCGSGYYACCNANNNNCSCAKVPEQ